MLLLHGGHLPSVWSIVYTSLKICHVRIYKEGGGVLLDIIQ